LIAFFGPGITYALTLIPVPEEYGTAETSGSYPQNSIVEIEAIPYPGYKFVY